MSIEQKYELINCDSVLTSNRRRCPSFTSSVNFSVILDQVCGYEQGSSQDASHYANGLLMRLEDVRSHYLRSTPTEMFSIAMTEYYDLYVNESEMTSLVNATVHRKDAFATNANCAEEVSRVNTLEKFNDLFFSQFDVFDQMEKEYKSQIDGSYQCSQYKEKLSASIFDQKLEVVEKLKQENERIREELLREQESLKTEKRNFKNMTQQLEEKMNELHKLVQLRNIEHEAFVQEKNKFEAEKKTFETEKVLYQRHVRDLEENLNTRSTLASSQISPRTPKLLSRVQYEEKDMIEQIKQYLSLGKSPTETAICIIDDIQMTVKEYDNYKELDRFRFQSSTLKIREQAINTRLKVEVKEIEQKKKELEKQFKFIDAFKGRNSEESKEQAAFQIIRYEKKLYEEEKKQLRMILNAIHSLQLELKQSVDLYKDSFANLLGVYNAIEQKKGILSCLAEKICGSIRKSPLN